MSKKINKKNKNPRKVSRLNLKRLLRFFTIVPALFLLFTLGMTPARAANGINKQINFQGKLVDNNGLNVADNTYTVIFSLYNVSSGGTATWTETDSVTTVAGVFQVPLGAVTSLTGFDFNQNTWYLGMKVGSDAEMTPRIRYSAVPYAFTADSLDGVVATNSATAFSLTGSTAALQTLTVNGNITIGSTITPTSAGALTVQSNGANGLTLDTGAAAAITIGGTNANAITIGNTSGVNNTAITLNTGGTGSITLGSNNGIGNVLIQPNAGGQAALIVKDQGSGDLFTASAGASTKFVIQNGGSVGIGNGIPGATLDITGATNDGSTDTLRVASNNRNGYIYEKFVTTPNVYATIGGWNVTGNKFAPLNFPNADVSIGNFPPAASGLLNVEGNGASGNALVNINQQSVGDIFTASSSGITRLSIQNNGTLALFGATSGYTGFIAAGTSPSLIYTLPSSAPASNGYVLSSLTNGTLSWVASGGGGSCATCVQLVPANTAANTIAPTAASTVGLTVNTSTNATTADGIDVVTTHTSGTAVNGILVNQNAAGTTTNGLQIQQTSGTLTNGLSFTGTIANDITTGSSNRNLTIAPNGTGAVNVTSGVTTGNGMALTVNSVTTGNGLLVTSSGTITGVGNLVSMTGNNVTTGTVLSVSGTGITSGKAINVIGGTGATTGSDLYLNGAIYKHTTAETGSLAVINFNDQSSDTTGADTTITNGLNVLSQFTTTGSAIKNINGINIAAPSTQSCTTGACTWTGLKITTPASATSVTANGIALAAGGVAGADLMSISTNGNGVTTAGVNALQITYDGGAANVESGAFRVNLNPGSTSGGVWNGSRIVTNTTGPASGVTETGEKIEGPTSGGAGTFNGVNIINLLPGTNGTVNGVQLTTTAVTQSAANTASTNGILLSTAGALNTNTAAGTINWNGMNFTSPASTVNFAGSTITTNGLALTTGNITQTAGTVTSNGVNVTLGTITTGGTQNGIKITPSNSNATGTEVGVAIGAITAGAATENAITIGSGWDADLVVNATTILNGSGVLQSAGLSGTYSNALTLSSTSNAFTGSTLALTPASNTTGITVTGTNVSSANLLNLDSRGNTSGTVLNLSYGAAKTLAGALTGQAINLSTNVTATNQGETGLAITLAGPTNTNTSGTNTYSGLSITGGVVTQNGAGGTSTTTDVSLTTPNITGTAGTISATGQSITLGTITTAGTQTGISITTGAAAAGTVNAINIGAASGASTTKTAIVIGASWNNSIKGANSTTGTSINIIGGDGSTGPSGGVTIDASATFATTAGAVNIGNTSASSVVIGNGTSGETDVIQFPTSTCTTSGTAEGVIFKAAGTQEGHFCFASGTGMKIFANSTITSGTDVAENYSDVGNVLEPGDLVVLDVSGPVKSIVKTETAYADNIFGVVSTNPGVELSDISESNGSTELIHPKPIALTGRIPTKVSTENGNIATGDYLTSSSTPGIAMKATHAGYVIGQALENYTNGGIGKILVFARTAYFNGLSNTAITQGLSGSSDLAPFIGQSTNNAIQVTTDGKIVINADYPENAITFDKNGNATFAGVVSAKAIQAGQIIGLDDTIATLSADIASVSGALGSSSGTPVLDLPTLSVDGLATISADLRVKGNSLIEGILSVVDTIKANNFIATGISDFFGNVIFHNNVTFTGHTTFTSDTAGIASIKQGNNAVSVTFTNGYSQIPVVNATLTASASATISPTDAGQALLQQGYSYVITDRTTKGFTILLNKSALQDITFSWIAIATDNATVQTSVFGSQVTPTPPINAVLPTVTQTP